MDQITAIVLAQIPALFFFLFNLLLLQRLLDEGILQDGELLALLARARPCHDLLGLLRAVAVPDHVGAAAQLALWRVEALVRFPVLKGSDPPLLDNQTNNKLSTIKPAGGLTCWVRACWVACPERSCALLF